MVTSCGAETISAGSGVAYLTVAGSASILGGSGTLELDGMAGEPMDVLVNGCLIAQGEVVVINDKFGIRLTDIVTPSDRVRKLGR